MKQHTRGVSGSSSSSSSLLSSISSVTSALASAMSSLRGLLSVTLVTKGCYEDERNASQQTTFFKSRTNAIYVIVSSHLH